MFQAKEKYTFGEKPYILSAASATHRKEKA